MNNFMHHLRPFALALALGSLAPAQNVGGTPPVQWLGDEILFLGGSGWPASLLGVEKGAVRPKRSLGSPTTLEFDNTPVLREERLYVPSWTNSQTPEGARTTWQLQERGLEAGDTWKTIHKGALPEGSKLRALVPLDAKDTFLLVGWLPHLPPEARRCPAHRVKIRKHGDMEVLEFLGDAKDALVRVLGEHPRELGSTVIHGFMDDLLVILSRSYGIGWILDEKGRHRRTFSLSDVVTAERIEKGMNTFDVVIQSHGTPDGHIWILARSEDCLEAASLREAQLSQEHAKAHPLLAALTPPAPPATVVAPGATPLPSSPSPVRTAPPWDETLRFMDEVIRRNPWLRWLELNPSTGKVTPLSTPPFGGVDRAQSNGELMMATLWIPGPLGSVLPFPKALMSGASEETPEATNRKEKAPPTPPAPPKTHVKGEPKAPPQDPRHP